MALTDKNLFAYCDNNPVMREDNGGEFWDVVLDIGFLVWSVVDVVNDPGDWHNWAALVVDVAFAVVPFVPSGVGQIIKAGNKIENVSDVAKAIKKLDTLKDTSKVTIIGQSMDRVHSFGNMLSAANNLYDGFKAYDRLSDMGRGGKILAEVFGKADNIAWLYGKLRKGYTIVDIGFDVAKATMSSSYIVESSLLAFWKFRNAFKALNHISNY